MTTYNTGNPVPSADARDRYDNSQTLDEVVNGDSESYSSRTGKQVISLGGMNSRFNNDQEERESAFNLSQEEKQEAFQSFLDGAGWSSLGAYGAGVVITSHTQTVDYQGQPYQLKPSIPASLQTPYVTTGVWATEGVNFKLVGDNSLRQNLNDPVGVSNGAGIVGRALRMINSVQEISGLVGRYANEPITLRSWHAGLNFGSGNLFWAPNVAKSKHDGGVFFSPTVPYSATTANYLAALGETDPTGFGCWVRPDSDYWYEWFGAIPFVNNGGEGIDATASIQKALYSAKRNPPLLTHSISDLRPVRGNGMFLVKGALYYPEGISTEATDPVSGGFAFGWTGATTKISGYGKLHDILSGNAPGTTFTKNWGIKNMSLTPYYFEAGPASCIYLDLLRDIEPRLENVRFIMHKGAVSGGQLNATGIRFDRVEDADFNSVTLDGGSNHLSTVVGAAWGTARGRMSRIYSYNARDNALFLASGSNNNKIDIEIQMPEQVGTNYGVNIDDGYLNQITVLALGSKLRYGAIISGHNNTVIGTVTGALVSTADVRGEDNQAFLSYTGPDPVDTGKNSVIVSSKGIKIAGSTRGNKKDLSIPVVNTWYDVARVSFTSGASATCVVKATTSMEVAGNGRDCFDGRWFVQQSTAGAVGSTFDVANKFTPSGWIEMQIVSAGTNIATLQVRIKSGTSAVCDVQFELCGNSKAFIKAL